MLSAQTNTRLQFVCMNSNIRPPLFLEMDFRRKIHPNRTFRLNSLIADSATCWPRLYCSAGFNCTYAGSEFWETITSFGHGKVVFVWFKMVFHEIVNFRSLLNFLKKKEDNGLKVSVWSSKLAKELHGLQKDGNVWNTNVNSLGNKKWIQRKGHCYKMRRCSFSAVFVLM